MSSGVITPRRAMRWKPVTIATVVAALAGSVLVPSGRPEAKGRYSEACPGTSESLPEGDYEGSFSWKASGSGQINIVVDVRGTLDLTVGEDGVPTDATADVEMAIDGGGAFGTSLSGQGGGSMKMSDARPRGFKVSGKLTGSGSFGSSLKTFSGTGSEEAVLDFGIQSAQCMFGSGIVLSPMFTQIVNGFKKAGLSASVSGGTWEVARSGESAARLSKLKASVDDLVAQADKGQCGGLACGRVMPQRIQKLIKEAQSASKAERECALTIILEGARQIYGSFIDNGVGDLNAARKRFAEIRKAKRSVNLQHEFELLKAKIKPLLEYSRQLAELGLEGCTGSFLTEIASALGGVANELIRAAAQQREPLMLLQISKQVALLGATADAAEGVSAELLAMSNTGAKEAFNNLRKLKKSRGACSDEVQTAWQDMKFWAGQAKVLGDPGWSTEVASLAGEMEACS